MSRTLRETLEAFASELVTSEILMNALLDGGYDAPPERADDLEDFANGPLRAEITAVLGGEVADAVVHGIAPVLTMMRRAERDTSVPQSTPREPAAMPREPASSTREIAPSETPTIAPQPQPPPVARALRPVSRPDLPSVPPARAAIPIPPTLLHSRPSKTGKSTPPARAATPAPRPATHPDSPRRTQRERR